MKIFKKEKEVVNLAKEYLDTVQACITPAEAAVNAYIKGDLTEAADLRPKVAKLESKADQVRRTIADKLFSGAYMPLMRGDIYSIFEALDRVPNAAEACCGFYVSQKPDIPAEFADQFAQITSDSFSIVGDLSTAVKEYFKPKGKIASVRECVKAVGKRESVVDSQEWDLTEAIFNSPNLDLAQKMHLKKALDRIVDIPDRAEDAAETLSVVAMKSII